jgi:hypothetical protein
MREALDNLPAIPGRVGLDAPAVAAVDLALRWLTAVRALAVVVARSVRGRESPVGDWEEEWVLGSGSVRASNSMRVKECHIFNRRSGLARGYGGHNSSEKQGGRHQV